MGNGNNQQRNTGITDVSVLDTTIDLEPVGAVWNITSQQVTDYVQDYLEQRNIAGVEGVRLNVVSEGRINEGQAPKVTLYVYLSLRSSDVTSNMGEVPPALRKLMDTSSLAASDRLYKALSPMVQGRFQLSALAREGVAYIKLDLFRVLGFMLAVKPQLHELTIMDLKKTGKDRAVFMVVKTEAMVGKATSGAGDRLTRLTQMIDHR